MVMTVARRSPSSWATCTSIDSQPVGAIEHLELISREAGRRHAAIIEGGDDDAHLREGAGIDLVDGERRGVRLLGARRRDRDDGGYRQEGGDDGDEASYLHVLLRIPGSGVSVDRL